MFRPAVMEAFFRSPPWLPFFWLPPLIALAPIGPETLAGAVSWLLLEYLMHRFFFHLPGDSQAARGVRFVVHEHHHACPMDEGRIVATPWQIASALGVIAAVASVLTPSWTSVTAGAALAYLAYEAIHYRIHHETGGGRILRALRRHHLAHHARPERGFGISSPLFDYLLGTRTRPPR